MSAMGWFRFAFLAYASKPVADRQIYRTVRRLKITSVLEVGVGSLERAKTIVAACQRCSDGATVRYAAVDWFEERPESMTPLSLIQAHRELNATGAKVRVSPGGPAAIEAVANALPNTDLVLISPDVDDDCLERGWYFLPRMCHAGTVVLRGRAEGNGEYRYEQLSHEAVAALAQPGHRSLAA